MTSLGLTGRMPYRIRSSLSDAPLALLGFPALWMLCVALAQIHVLAIQQSWSKMMWAVALVVPTSYVFGGLAVTTLLRGRVRRSLPQQSVRSVNVTALRWILFSMAVVGNLEEAHQFAAARTIPLLSSQIDANRFALPGGPTIILTDLLTVAAVVALVRPRRLLARSAVPEIAIAAFALLGFALAGGRGTIAQALGVVLISRWLRYGRPPTRFLVACALIGLALSVGVFHLRSSQHQSDPLGVELQEKVYPALPRPLRPLVPVDLALAMNLHALSRLVLYFPAHAGYGHGAYNAHGADLFVPGARDLQEVSVRLSGPWVASTVAGPLWADGGLLLVAAGLAIIGAMVAAAEQVARATRELRFILVAANLAFLSLFGIYANLWTYQIDWVVITPLLYCLGAVAEGVPIIPTRASARVREHSSSPSPSEP